MLKLENTEVLGWEHAIRGMRISTNSLKESDSGYRHYSNLTHTDMGLYIRPQHINDELEIGSKDLNLMKWLLNAGIDQQKFMRMITVYVDILAPLYWWKEFDQYASVKSPYSMIDDIMEKEFMPEDFSCEHLMDMWEQEIFYSSNVPEIFDFKGVMEQTISALNNARQLYLETHDKKYWWQMIQLLPTSYNQCRTVMLDYETLIDIYGSQKDNPLDEWKTMMDWIGELPYSELITGSNED